MTTTTSDFRLLSAGEIDFVTGGSILGTLGTVFSSGASVAQGTVPSLYSTAVGALPSSTLPILNSTPIPASLSLANGLGGGLLSGLLA